MNRIISALCASALATFVAGCGTDLPSSPTAGAPASPHVTISKASVVCNSGCTSNNNGMGPGGDTIWMAVGSEATVQPHSQERTWSFATCR